MMQDPDHQKAKCAKCKAGRGEPCVDRFGNLADKVHYGRPYWSAMVDRKFIKLRGAGLEGELELELELLEFKVIDVSGEPDHVRPRLNSRPAPPIPASVPVATKRPSQPCGHCGADARPYMNGWCCDAHAPGRL